MIFFSFVTPSLLHYLESPLTPLNRFFHYVLYYVLCFVVAFSFSIFELLWTVCVLLFVAFGTYFAIQHRVKIFDSAQFLTNCFLTHCQITHQCHVLSFDSQHPYPFLYILYPTTAENLETTFPRGPGVSFCQWEAVT